MPTLKETVAFVERAHAGQVDAAGQPYILHPKAVLSLIGPDVPETWQHAALLHDVVEDTKYTLEDLSELGYWDDVLWIISVLTRQKGQAYFEYIRHIAEFGGAGAIAVKLADLAHNSHPGRLSKLGEKKAQSLGRRYRKAKQILLQARKEL